MDELAGKTVIVDYETGYLFKVEYISKEKLRWTSLKERTDGSPMSGEETYYAYKIRDGLYTINWIEEGGLAVSQIADFSKGKVYAFMTWNQEGERGNRGNLLHKGTLEEK